MSHTAGTHGSLRLRGTRKPRFYRLEKDRDGTYYRRRFRLTDRAQRERQVMNIIAFPCRPDPSDPCHRDAVLSALYLRDSLARSPGTTPPSWGLLGRHLANCVFNNPAAWVSTIRQMSLRSRRPRLPFVLPHDRVAQDAVYFQGEHAPNPASRLLLSDERDDFGVPRITPCVRFSDIDYRTVREFYTCLDQSLRAGQAGYLAYDEAGLQQHLDRLSTHFHSMAHHLGTTRMSANPESGVVDRNCRVHSVSNLYVSGSSVFPTSGHANPTLTILALALRLADHLVERCRGGLRVETATASVGQRTGAPDLPIVSCAT
jgi:choline dehydrogenase-like flavoprotein